MLWEPKAPRHCLRMLPAGPRYYLLASYPHDTSERPVVNTGKSVNAAARRRGILRWSRQGVEVRPHCHNAVSCALEAEPDGARVAGRIFLPWPASPRIESCGESTSFDLFFRPVPFLVGLSVVF